MWLPVYLLYKSKFFICMLKQLWSRVRPNLTGQVLHKAVLTLDISYKSDVPRTVITSDKLVMSLEVPIDSFKFYHLLEWPTELRKQNTYSYSMITAKEYKLEWAKGRSISNKVWEVPKLKLTSSSRMQSVPNWHMSAGEHADLPIRETHLSTRALSEALLHRQDLLNH